MVFYLPLAVASVLPFQCEGNPDGTSSVQTMRSVLCGKGPLTGLVVLACIGCLFYMVGPLALVILTTVSYPQKVLHQDGIAVLKAFNLCSNVLPLSPTTLVWFTLFGTWSLPL